MNFRLVWVGSDDDPPKPQVSADKVATGAHSLTLGAIYERSGTGMVRRQGLENGCEKVTPIANFSARIVRDIILDDDATQNREFGVEAELGGQRLAFVVSAAQFGRMGWVLRQLGPLAIIYPGQQQHARAAIQSLSGSIKKERIFTHLGWKKHEGHWVYLHAGGALGAQGACDWTVELPPALQHFQFHPSSDNLREKGTAVRASLRCLSVALDWITFPLMAAVYRAALGKVDFSLFLTGQTGLFKSALSALCQQHFGASMDARSLPANFASTGNALQGLAFYAKDSLLVVDDFAPSGRHSDKGLENIAEVLFRASGNQQGRSRLTGNGRLTAPKPPRALLLATGEEVPRGQSIRARLLILDVRPGDVDQMILSECQRAGDEGGLAASMAAFLTWIASDYETVHRRLQNRVLEIRSQGHGRAVHARLPSALAELQAGWETFLQFALEVGALGKSEKKELEQRGQRAFDQLCALQTKYKESSDPALRFVSLLRAALACGLAHVTDRHGHAPKEAEFWGWRRTPVGQECVPLGTKIGWVSANDIFLDPTASYEVAQVAAGAERLRVSAQSLRHSLSERGFLVSIDAGRQMVLVRRILECAPRQVLHLNAGDLLGPVACG